MRAGAVGDLDGDHRAEIFFTAQESPSVSYDFQRTTLFGVDEQGQLLPGFPMEFYPVAGGTIELGDLHIVDLDGDGGKEVVFAETSSNGGADLYRFAVHAIDRNGQELSGWPFALEGTISDVGYAVPEKGGTLAIGDVDGDGSPEIAVMPGLGSSGSVLWGSTAIRVLAGAGYEMHSISNIHRNEFGVMTAAKSAGLYIADVDADGRGEVLTSRYITLGPNQNKVTALAVLAYSGTELVGQWIANDLFDPATGATYIPHPGAGIGLAVDDIDNDGSLDITYAADAYTAAAPGLLTDSIIYAWDLGVPHDRQALHWPVTGGSVARTGEYPHPSQTNGDPQAHAGSDQTVVDADADGLEAVLLDGSESFDPDGAIVSYEWLEYGQVIATGFAPTVHLEVGVHVITLIVTDDASLTGSDEVIVTVQAANAAPVADAGPDQEVTDTDSNGTERVILDGSGSYDPDGAIVSYEWLDNGQVIANGVAPAVDFPVGTHDVTLVLSDDGEPALTATGQVRITVAGPADNTPPTVTITHPQGDGTVSRKATVVVSADAYDDSGPVGQVEIFVNGELKITDTSPPFEYVWNVPGAKNKAYVLEARAYDAAGNLGVSHPVQVLAQ
jgi:hypothetical protein